MEPVLYGYQYSVYTWIVRSVAAVAGIDYTYLETDPFADQPNPAYLALNPFQRVPTVKHNGQVIYETAAITRYLDDAFNDGRLQRDSPVERSRQNQIISIVDAYGYWPMVRQVFSHGYFCALEGEVADPEELARGLERSRLVLGAIENLLQPDRKVIPENLNLADFHLAPMVNYFCRTGQGRTVFSAYPALSRWYAEMTAQKAFTQTMPDLALTGC